MASVNRVTLLGNVGDYPKETANGCTFPLATYNVWKDKEGITQRITEWHSIKAFGYIASNILKWVSKGDPLYIEGRLVSSRKEDGTYNSSVKVDVVEFLGKLGKNK